MGNVRSRVGWAALARRFAGLGLAAALAGCDSGSDAPTTPAPIPAPAPAPEPAPPPSKDDPAAFTQAFVQQAVDLFEAEGLEATEEGVWVTYWQPNPGAGGEQQLKHTFARRHGNLVFASGYYEE